MDGITLKPPLLRLPLEGKEEDGSSIWAQTGISFRGPVGFDSVCFGDVHARVVGSADLARKWSVAVTKRGDTVRTGCCKWEAMRWLLFVCLFFFYERCVSLGCRYESEPQLFLRRVLPAPVCPAVLCLCETQRCTVILLFTVSIRFNFLYPRRGCPHIRPVPPHHPLRLPP